ncbi:MAG: peroxiredoxin [Candidatus Thermoplasmatota archaeon]
MSTIEAGQKAPDFTLPDSNGTPLSLHNLRRGRPVVLFFYPKDFTPGCTAEACAFRDAYEDFKDAGAEVVGISSDTDDSHADFAERHKLPFVLLSDRGAKVQALYGVRSMFGMLPGRVTFVIDQAGVVRHVFNSQMQPTKHVEEAIAVVRRLVPVKADAP